MTRLIRECQNVTQAVQISSSWVWQMRALPSLILTLTIATVSLPANSQNDRLFVASSKAQGTSFDLLVTETERLPTKSYLLVPGFHERTAAGARWLMCAYTALAKERGFSYWHVTYPAPSSTQLMVALSNSASSLPAELLEKDYVKERAVGEDMMPVSKMVAFCAIK